VIDPHAIDRQTLLADLIRALAKKAARDHMQEKPSNAGNLQRECAKRVGLRPLPPAA
jgi:hypothetical protein